MVYHIQTSQEPEGGWVARVPALPGLQIFGNSQYETLATARKLTAILLQEDEPPARQEQRILVFYPGRPPESAYGEA